MARLWLVTILIMGMLATPAFGTTIQGASSWYGGPCDSQDNNRPATGIPNTVPGIALYQQWSFRDFWLLKENKTARKIVVRHTDYGPAPWTGKTVDINYKAAMGLGYKAPGGCVQGYPTGQRVKVRLLVKKSQIDHWVKKTKTKVDDKAF